MAEFRPTDLYRKRLLAERQGKNVWLWYEGENTLDIYTPDTHGYEKWAALADEQAKITPDINRKD